MPVGFGERVDLGGTGDFLDGKRSGHQGWGSKCDRWQSKYRRARDNESQNQFHVRFPLDRWMAIRRALAAVFTAKKPRSKRYPSGPFRTIQRWEDAAHINV
jgi:hypothetical protein